MQGTIRLTAFLLASVALPSLYGGDNNASSSLEKLPSPNQVASLVKSLTSDRYLQRAAAMEQLVAAARHAPLNDRLYPALKQAAADPTLSVDVRLTLAAFLETARYTWLSSVSSTTHAPSDTDIATWISAFTSPGEALTVSSDQTAARQLAARRNAAERELVDALAQATTAPVVEQVIQRAIAREGLDDDALVRLRRLAEWARPGLAVEYWQRRRNLAIQYFIIGVPSQAPGAIRPTRFDRVTDDFAVCASGNALGPGDYPLGVAFPHPREQTAFFHLVSLPTVRERLVHQYESRELENAQRLQAITERTLGPAVAQRRPLDEAQLWVLGQLDQPTVARLLSVYFAEVPDEPFNLSQLAPMLTDVSSVHRAACMMLALDGSHEVVPMLVEASQNKRFLSLWADEPQAIPLIAALAIAAREPWDDVDAWLAGLVERTDQISFGQQAQGEVGATAAAMLLARNGEQPRDFGLLPREPLERGLHDRFKAPINADYRRRMYEDRMFKQLNLTPHFFADPRDREVVQAWWRRRQSSPSSTPPVYPRPAPTFTARAARP